MTRIAPLVLYAIAAGGIVLLNGGSGGVVIGIGLYGALTLGYLLVKLAASSAYTPAASIAPDGTVAVVVPVYNEDPEVFRDCIAALLRQSRPADELWVIDDASASTTCWRLAQYLLRDVTGAHVVRIEQNVGKRHAQAQGFSRSSADFIVTVDSDSVVADDAIAQLLAPFDDPRVHAVTGVARALNVGHNLLTRLIDLRYANAFLYERAAYSVLGGSVLCCTGVLSAYRGDLVREHLVDYLDQHFLGIPVAYGDDRRLTNYALSEGRAILQSSAVALTMVPTRIGVFLRQQVRWNRSFFRETLWSLTHLGPRRAAWWLTLAELTMWLAFSAAIVATLIVTPLSGGVVLGAYYLAYVALLAYARSVRYLDRGAGRRELVTLALAPLYGLLHLAVLMPLRFYSLSTLRDGRWGTRELPAAMPA